MCVCVTFREILILDDGGRLALDWAANLPAECDKNDAPVLLFLSGITGSSADNYVKYAMLDGMHHGYRPVVMNYRSCGGVRLEVNLHKHPNMDTNKLCYIIIILQTPRTHSATNIDDLLAVTNRIHILYPKAHIVGIGVSLGGYEMPLSF